MPYSVYRIGTLGIPEKLGSAPGYREADDLLTRPRVVDPTRDGEDG